MPWFSADLHLHSCLSPCGSLDSSPRRIAKTAAARGMDLVALSDHNSSLNCPAFSAACRDAGIGALYGMEATTLEEAHCLCLFEDLETALGFSREHYGTLNPVPNQTERWGDQVWVNENEEIEGEVEILLLSASRLSLEELGKKTQALGGLFIPAHVDRPSFSLMSQLGFVPPGNYDALEICRPDTGYSRLRFKPRSPGKGGSPTAPGPAGTSPTRQADDFPPPEPGGTPLVPALICNSDAHYPEDIARRHFEFWAPKPDFEGLRQALRRSWVKTRWQAGEIRNPADNSR